MQNIQIYSTQQCPYCVRARALLDARGLDYAEIDVTADNERMQEMVTRSGQRSVPQIFIDGAAIGGYQQLATLQSAGKL